MTEKLHTTKITEYSATPYDDVYRTMINDCPGLIIPVVNEVFGKKHKDGVEITVLNNELFFSRQDGKQLERITDSNFRIEDSRYLLECQSGRDGTILLRMFEYSSQIAVQDSELEGEELHVSFPHTGLLYLRHNRNTPDTMRITITVPFDECSYIVPVLKVQQYTVEELFEKKLYFLIPFHIFTYEHDFEEYNSNKEMLSELQQIYEDILERLAKITKEGKITEYMKHVIIDMSKKVLEHIAKKYENVKKGVDRTMGGQILDYEAKRILKSGIEQGLEQGLAAGQIEKLVEQINKKLAKGKTITVIAEELEETVETIEGLIKKYLSVV